MTHIKYLIATLFIVLVPHSSFADPSISSVSDRTASHGQVITINGSNFGSHADNNPKEPYLVHVWEDVEHNGGYIPNNNGIWNSSETEGILNSTGNRPGSGYNVKHGKYGSSTYTDVLGNTKTTSYKLGLCYNWNGSDKQQFLSAWYYLDESKARISGQDQIKIIGHKGYRLKAGKPHASKNYLGIHGLYKSRGEFKIDFHPALENVYLRTYLFPSGKWTKLDMWVDADGKVMKGWVNGRFIGSNVQHIYQIIQGEFCQYIRNNDNEYWFILSDDHYIDRTQARVFISNQRAYDDSDEHQQEMQIPRSWSSDLIRIEFNQGAFSDGETVYLYVIDSNGNVSNEWQIKIS